MRSHRSRLVAATAVAMLAGTVLAAGQQESGSSQQSPDGFRFRTGVELINVTATVTDASGRFVPDLRQDDFVVYEDGEPQQITHFSAERVPVSLGIALDTSGSMSGEKFEHAEAALDRFLFDLLDRDDEVFLYRFSNDAALEQDWTTDRARVSRALRQITPRGGTAMYDAVAEAVPLADSGRNRKKALVLISDGNDTASQASITEVQQLIRETEVMVYAIGIDGTAEATGGIYSPPQPRRRPPIQIPFPFPVPGRRGGGPSWPGPPQGGSRGGTWSRGDDRVNVAALRAMTDDSGGRTEIVRTSRDLDPATARIADELSKQYFFAYPAAAKKDGRWHTIRVEVRDGRYHVRARRGYVAS
jgi:Ca-activated chloride channel family protein